MKIIEYRDDYYLFTGKLSDINRQIAFAGIALIWLFRKESGADIKICTELILPLIFLVISLGLDMIQYIYQSILCYSLYKWFDKKYKNDPDYDSKKVNHSNGFNLPTWVLFWLKIISMIIAYILIVSYLIKTII